MAIGRANGDIEIWNPMQGTWLLETTIPGGRGRSVEGLAWVVGDDEELDGASIGRNKKIVVHGGLRLFSIGYTNTITEWDLDNGRAKRHASGQHGELWCLAAQPKAEASDTGESSSASNQLLVGGTMDGSLALYTTEDDDLRFVRLCRTSKKSIKIVSLAFQTRNLAVAGCSDGTLRVFDIRTGALLHHMTIGRDLVGERTGNAGSKDVIVWCVRCLPNGDIVSGDSTGQIIIWDGVTYTQAQHIQGHSQDVLSLATSADGFTIVSGGMDRRVVLYRGMAGHASRWAKVWHRRYHKHDVKALGAFETGTMSVVVAGGPDATPVVLPLEKSGMEHHRTLSHLPQAVPVASAPDARLAICWWERRIDVWAFGMPSAPDDELQLQAAGEAPEDEHEDEPRLVGRIQVRGEGNIVTAAISSDGSLVVVVTATEVKAFQLRRSADGELVISKVLVPASAAAKGATSVTIAPNGHWICLAHGVDKQVTILETVQPAAEESAASNGDSTGKTKTQKLSFRPKPIRLARLRRSIPRYQQFSGLGRYNRRVTRLAFSPDSKLLAAADLSGYIDTWVLQGPDGVVGDLGEEDGDDTEMADLADSESSDSSSDEDNEDATNGSASDNAADNPNRWVPNPRARQLPKLATSPVVLSFAPDVPGNPSTVGDDADGRLATDYVLLAITATARLFVFNPLRARFVPWMRRMNPDAMPVEYRNIRDMAKDALWQGPRVWIYGASFLFMLDTSVNPMPAKGVATDDNDQENQQQLQQHPSTQEPPLRKRKRGDDTGAGSRMEKSRMEPQLVQMTVPNAEGGGSEWVAVDMEAAAKEATSDANGDDGDEDDEDDDDETDSETEAISSQLPAQLNQPEQKQQKKATRMATRRQRKREEEMALQTSGGKCKAQTKARPPRWWHTFKYRPILGVVPLAASAVATAAAAAAPYGYPPLEVALVERPAWDIDLPLRYGDNER